MFKDLDISSFKKQKPPSDSSFDTFQEIKALTKVPLRKEFVKKYDNIEASFKKAAKENNVKDYDKKLVAKLVEESAPIVLKLKKHFNRPRPKVLAKKMNIKMEDIEMESMKTPSYPSGHSTQAFLIANVLGDKYPKAKKSFMQTAKNISYSRQVAHAHYKSDSKKGEELGNLMYKHIKNKI